MEKVLEQILSDLQNGKLSHAILLEGGSQEKRHAFARTVAKALVCSGKAVPCDICADCIKANADSHPDILFYAGGATVGSFKVDTVREIRRVASVLPNEAERKVFVLENTQAMAAGAQNALLKILEEPPYYVHFILTCPSQSAMLDTVLSRVTVYTCPQEQNETNTADLEKARTVASSILKNVAVKKEWDVLKETAQFEKDKDFFTLCCQEMRSLAELALVNKVADLPADETVEQISSLFPKSKLISVIDVCANTLDSIQKNLNGNLLITLFCAQLLTDQYGRI
ncbi:MAG: hypothetical protein ACI4I5_03130 [Acutalibacteraceae bacterium]